MELVNVPKLLNTGDSELVALNTLIPHPDNANEGDSEAIKESIEENGFWGSLVCQKSTRYILAGNHRASAAQSLGYTHLPVNWVDVDEIEALTILAADNRTSRLGHDNEEKLADILARVSQQNASLAGTGYTPGDLDDLITRVSGQSDRLTSVSETTTTSKPLQLLKFGRYEVPLNEYEFERLETAAKIYIANNGNLYGFMTDQLKGV